MSKALLFKGIIRNSAKRNRRLHSKALTGGKSHFNLQLGCKCFCMLVSYSLLFVSCMNGDDPAEILADASRLSDSIPSQALMRLEKIKDVKKLSEPEQAEYNLIFAKSMLRSGNKLSTDSVIHAAIRYYLARYDSVGLHQSFYLKGLYHNRVASHDSAAFYFNKAMESTPESAGSAKKSNYQRMAGYSYLYLGDKERAISTQKEAYQNAISANDTLSVIYCRHLIS